MSDIVHRLRSRSVSFKIPDPLMEDAADEIERLRGGRGEPLRFLSLFTLIVFTLIVSGWLLSATLAIRLYAANDTIRMLRATSDTLTADEREAVEVTVEILEAGEVPKILRPHLTKTLRGLLERL